MFYAYILESKNRDEFYTGYTSNLRKRLTEHNQKLNLSTKKYAPWKLIYYEACINVNDAKRREKWLKTTHGHRMIKRRLKDYLNIKSRKI